MKKVLSLLMIVAFAGSMAIAQGAMSTSGAQHSRKAAMEGKAEKHPHIRAAIHSLEEARKHVDQAPSDFGGHKANAARAIDTALSELKQCLTYDGK